MKFFTGEVAKAFYSRKHESNSDPLPPIPDGWTQLVLTDVGRERIVKDRTARGAVFTFTAASGPAAGRTFRRWFCTEAFEETMLQAQEEYEHALSRIAWCAGFVRLSSLDDLLGRPFWAKLARREFSRAVPDPETGLPVLRKTSRLDFDSSVFTDCILTGTEYLALLLREARERDREYSLGLGPTTDRPF